MARSFAVSCSSGTGPDPSESRLSFRTPLGCAWRPLLLRFVFNGSFVRSFFVAGPALLGYPDLRQQSPELALLVIAFDFTLPMMLWMRFRGMAWRPTLEMSGATIGLAIVMIGLDWLDVVQTSTLRGLVFGFCGPACVVMLVVMLFRLELYTGRSGHHLGPVRHTVHAA